MASAPADSKPIVGRVDESGRLAAADPELERLQVEAGSRVGASLAIPQLAAIARVAQRLKIPVSRRAIAAGREQDVDMWVRAVPDGDGVALTIEQWSARPPSAPRLSATASIAHEQLEAQPLRWSVDEHLRLLDISPELAELLSSDPADAVGQPLTRMVRLEEDESGSMPLLEALASRGGFSGQRVRSREGDRELVLAGEPTPAPDGGFSGFEGTASLPGNCEARAEAVVPVDSAIHSALRSPLDSIVRSAQDMIEQSDAPVRAEYASYAADIASAARHLLSVVRSLGDQGESSPSGSVDLVKLASETVALVESAASEREIVVAVQPASTVAARGEARSVTQILVNLVGNAVRYSPPGTAVTISFRRSGQSVLVHVADEGPGIDPADRERIFEPFQKGSAEGDGSGLGLAIARRLARAMGGDVRLESASASGSRFTLELPAA